MGKLATAAPAFISARFMHIPPIRDEHINIPGFYFGGYLEDSTKNYHGFAMYESLDEFTGYFKVGEFPEQLVTGVLVSTPADSSVVDYRLVDRVSSFTITLTNPLDELESVSEEEMLAGRNRFLIGEEIIGAASIILESLDSFTGHKTYRLSTLLRGIKDTFDHMDSHFIKEPVTWLDGPGVYFYEHAASSIGLTKFFKMVSGGGIVVEACPYPVTLEGETVKPFRPVSILGTRDVSNNLTVTWERQSRRSIQTMQQGVRWEEELEQYKIRVLSGSGSSLSLRDTVVTIADGGTRTWTYTASQQTSDGLTPGNTVYLEILPMSSVTLDYSNSALISV